jgi:hypothetical protein
MSADYAIIRPGDCAPWGHRELNTIQGAGRLKTLIRLRALPLGSVANHIVRSCRQSYPCIEPPQFDARL